MSPIYTTFVDPYSTRCPVANAIAEILPFKNPKNRIFILYNGDYYTDGLSKDHIT